MQRTVLECPAIPPLRNPSSRARGSPDASTPGRKRPRMCVARIALPANVRLGAAMRTAQRRSEIWTELRPRRRHDTAKTAVGLASFSSQHRKQKHDQTHIHPAPHKASRRRSERPTPTHRDSRNSVPQYRTSIPRRRDRLRNTTRLARIRRRNAARRSAVGSNPRNSNTGCLARSINQKHEHPTIWDSRI